MVPAGISNRYQWRPKAPVEKPGVLSRGQWSRLRGTGWETGAFGLSQPVPKTRFLVVKQTPKKKPPKKKSPKKKKKTHKKKKTTKKKQTQADTAPPPTAVRSLRDWLGM